MKKLLLILLVFALSGCTLKQHQIEFKEIDNLEVNQSYNACEFIKSVDEVDINLDMIQSDRIVVNNNLVISCESSFKPNQIGDYMLTYQINDRQEKQFPVSIIDSISPEIQIKQEEYEVEVGNKYFNINNEISFLDNYDKDLHTSIDHNIDIDEVGEYEVIATAKDSSGNQTQEKLVVKVIEKEKEIETVYITTSRPSSSGINNSSGSSSNYSNTSSNSGTSSSTGGSGSASSGSTTPASNYTPPTQNNPTPYINGCSITVDVGSSINDAVAMATGCVSSSAGYTADYSNVNTSAPGTYVIYLYGSDGATGTSTVIVR